MIGPGDDNDAMVGVWEVGGVVLVIRECCVHELGEDGLCAWEGKLGDIGQWARVACATVDRSMDRLGPKKGSGQCCVRPCWLKTCVAMTTKEAKTRVYVECRSPLCFCVHGPKSRSRFGELQRDLHTTPLYPRFRFRYRCQPRTEPEPIQPISNPSTPRQR